VAEFTVPLAELNRDRWPSSPKPAETGDIPLRQAEGHAQSLPFENLLGTIRSGQCEAYRHSPDEVPRRFNEGGALTREEIQRGGVLRREVIQRGGVLRREVIQRG